MPRLAHLRFSLVVGGEKTSIALLSSLQWKIERYIERECEGAKRRWILMLYLCIYGNMHGEGEEEVEDSRVETNRCSACPISHSTSQLNPQKDRTPASVSNRRVFHFGWVDEKNRRILQVCRIPDSAGYSTRHATYKLLSQFRKYKLVHEKLP